MTEKIQKGEVIPGGIPGIDSIPCALDVCAAVEMDDTCSKIMDYIDEQNKKQE